MANRDFTPESTQHNVMTARQALAKADLQHALFHITSALSTDPLNGEWRGMLDQIISRAPDAMVFVRADQAKSDYITSATRAYVHAKRGELREACALLAQIAQARPDVPFLLWMREWLIQPGAAQQLSPDVVAQQILPPVLDFISKAPSPMDAADERRPNAEAAWDALAALHHAHPQDSYIIFGASVIGRRLGHFDQAINLAYQAFQMKNDWSTCIGLACAYRDGKRVDDAVAAFRHAHGMRPDDLAALLDMGDTLTGAERWDEAANVYGEVLQRQAGHPWAEPSLIYVQYKKSPTPESKRETKQRLEELAKRSGRAYALLCEIEPPVPYVNRLPGPGDATANALQQLMHQIAQQPQMAQGGKVGLNVTHPESPSVVMAFRHWAAANRFDIGVDFKVEKVQSPDPRVPKGPVDFVLWAYDGTVPRPNVPAPDPRAAGAVAEIARMPYDLAAWDGPARSLGAQMGSGWMQQLVCTMAHPPPLPDPKMDPFEWVQKVQIAAAMVTAYLDPPAWEGSTRQRALFSIARGPVDWTVDAAVIALAWLGRGDAVIRRDVEALFRELEQQIPKDGFTCYEYPLVCSWLAMGGHDEATAKRLAAWKTKIETKGTDGQTTAKTPEEKYLGLTLKEYAELSVRRDAITMKHGGGAGTALAAAVGGGAYPELAALVREYNLEPLEFTAAIGRIGGWDERIGSDPRVQEAFQRFSNEARMRLQGLDTSGNEGRVAEMIRQGAYDVEGAKQNAAAAAQQMAAGDGGDPDPLVFPGQKLERLSHYVALMKGMQTGDMNGALKKAGLDMGSYMQVAQAWGIKLASDPILTAKFGEMMAKP
jgi:tetratricopeptide (TPR) repeat protein